MYSDGARISLSVATVEFAQAAGGTALTWTEQGAYFDGFDGAEAPQPRREGVSTIQLWNMADPTRPTTLGGPLQARHQVIVVAFSPDGRTLAASSNDGYNNFGVGAGTIQLWDVADPGRPAALGSSGTAVEGYSSLAFSPDGCTLAAGTMLSVVQLWDITNPAHLTLLHSISDPARPTGPRQFATAPVPGFCSVAFSPDGRTLASGSDGAATDTAPARYNCGMSPIRPSPPSTDCPLADGRTRDTQIGRASRLTPPAAGRPRRGR
jgi:WD40 domain-containing protein